MSACRVSAGGSGSLGMLASVLCVLGLPVNAVAQTPSPVRLVDTIWGFDGQVVEGQFQPLSLLLDNTSEQPIEAVASLRSTRGGFRDTGGALEQSVYLGPRSRRWVQFYPFISSQWDDFRLHLTTADFQTFMFDQLLKARVAPAPGQPSASQPAPLHGVYLQPSGITGRPPTAIKAMPAEIFPPYAPATRGLHAVFLDHVPDWEAPRQDAFLSWLKCGGHVHLLLDQNRQVLRFSGALSVLNEPFNEFAVESGTVRRHEFQRAQLSDSVVAAALAAPFVASEEPTEATSREELQRIGGTFRTDLLDDSDMFDLLRDLTRPDHAWWLIFLLSLAYIALLFPGCWILSKQRNLHFLTTYAALIALAVVFSLFFLVIGQRGYGETTSIHTLAVARGEDATHWDVMAYDNVFVIAADDYSITAADQQALLASGAFDEQVDARIVVGNEARFETRIPPYSSEAVLSRRRIAGPDWQLQLRSISVDGARLNDLTIGYGAAFPVDDSAEYFALFGRMVHTLSGNRTTGTLTLVNSATPLPRMCYPADPWDAWQSGPLGTWTQVSRETDPFIKCWTEARPRLLLRMLEDDMSSQVSRFLLPADRVRLLVYAPLPESMQLTLPIATRRQGRVLYVRDLRLSSGPAESAPGNGPDTDEDAAPAAALPADSTEPIP